MPAMTLNPATADNSWDTGYSEGDRDATNGLTETVARGRAEQADPYDPLWAAGYWDGYLHRAAVLACSTQTAGVR